MQAEAQCRSVFAVFAVTKSPLLLGAQIWNFTNETLATVGNPRLIAVNQVRVLLCHSGLILSCFPTSSVMLQDPLGIPARKLAAANGRVSPYYVGLAPCTTSNVDPGVNGVTAADLRWKPMTLNASVTGAPNGSVALLHVASGRCLATRSYLKLKSPVPVLLPCDSSDSTQAWLLPQPLTVTHVINAALNLSLAAGTTTVWGTQRASAATFYNDVACRHNY